MGLSNPVKYPEHIKLAGVNDKSEAVGSFLDWLQTEKGVFLAEYLEDTDEGRAPDHPVRFHYSMTELLGEFFDIDVRKLEAEKREMLDEIRKSEASGGGGVGFKSISELRT